MADEKKDQKSTPKAKKPAAKKADEKSRCEKTQSRAEKNVEERGPPRPRGLPAAADAKRSSRRVISPAAGQPRSDSSGAGRGAKPAPLVVRASSRYVRIAPRKARLIADQVRGLQIEKARALLQFSPRGAARDIGKLIDSAAANAENNHDLVADEMRVAEITVDEGPTLRRFRPRALGRATPINKRTSHIAVALSPEEEI